MLREIVESLEGKLLKGYKKAYHVGNPSFRKNILAEGLVPQKGASYLAHYGDKNMGPVIFFSLDKDNLFDSTYDDDLWEITIPKDLEYYEDPSMKFPYAYTKTAISPKNLKLLYKGTGDSTL